MISRIHSPRPSDDMAHPAPLLIQISHEDDGTLVVTLTGEADLATSPWLRQALSEATGVGCPCVVVNLDRLTFMDASTLGALAEAHRHFTEAGGTFEVECHTRLNRRLLAIGGLDGLLSNEA